LPGVFISYRRSDAIAWAGRLHDSLEKHFPGVSIFMDIEAIPPGVKFEPYIRDAVGSCDVLLVLIGPNWLTAVDSEGNRRLDNPKDFVALEIVAALDRDVRIIPTLVGGTPMPPRPILPEPLRPLCDFNNFVIADLSWKDDCTRLAKHIEGVVTRPRPVSPTSKWRLTATASAIFAVVSVALFLWWWQYPVPQPTTPETKTPPALPSSSPVETPSVPTGVDSILDLGLDGRWELVEAVAEGKKQSEQMVVEVARAGDVLKIGLQRTPQGQSQGALALTAKPNQITLNFFNSGGQAYWTAVFDRESSTERGRFRVTFTGIDKQKPVEIGWVNISEDWRRFNGQLNFGKVNIGKDQRFDVVMTIGRDGKSIQGRWRGIGPDYPNPVLVWFRKQ
jgi:hypothetical protein